MGGSLISRLEQIDLNILQSGRIPADPAAFRPLLRDFSPVRQDYEELLICPPTLPYGRNTLFSSGRFEAVLMNWKPGRSSNIHDHGRSFGCVLGLHGSCRTLLFGSDLGLLNINNIEAGQICDVPKGIFHQIENPTAEFAATLHFYLPPIENMQVVDDLDQKKVYVVKAGSGSWKPEENDVIDVIRKSDGDHYYSIN